MTRLDDGPALEELFAHLPVTADWTMGFLTAICSGPDAIAVAAWIPEVLPDPDAKKVDLLTRLCGAVVETLADRPEIIPPEADKPVEDAIEFCRGYVRGAGLHPTWRSDAVAMAKLAPFDATEREQLGRAVLEVRDYWKSKRQVVHASPKVGRNDPCPCGSGKKHKKCCGR